MKNKKIIKTLFVIFYLFFGNYAFSEEFYFETPEILAYENGNLLKALKGGKAITDKNVEVIADEFEFNKITTLLKAQKNAQVIDKENKITIYANKIFYLKNKEKIYTEGKTKIVIGDEYFIWSSDIFFLRNEMEIFSGKKTSLKDYNNLNFYTTESFKYKILDKLFRGKNINMFTSDEDEYLFSDGFVNLKNNEMQGKDLLVNFNKEMFNNSDNEPRLKGNTAYSNQLTTKVSKGVFTTCKKRDGKCPPWKVESREVEHNKTKKIVYYKNAWLKVYDVPVMYYPRFFHPDPTVERQSGLLKPQIGRSKILGSSSYIPYFYVISDEKDLTFKPRFFDNNKYTLQTEYRHVTKKSENIIDLSLTKGHNSGPNDPKDSRSHFFSHSKISPDFEYFENSNINIQLQKTSNDTYLKLFNLESPLFGFQEGSYKSKSIGTLNSYVDLKASNDDFSFNTSMQVYEKLNTANSNRYEYIFPNYDLSKIIDTNDRLKGTLSFNSAGSQHYHTTNITESIVRNDLSYSSQDKFLSMGIKNKYNMLFKNINTKGKNSTKFKKNLETEILSSFLFESSYPLIRNGINFDSYLTPKLALKYSPNSMKNLKNDDRRINTNNIWSVNRIANSDTVESGQSLTIGTEYKKSRKINNSNYKSSLFDNNLVLDVEEPLNVVEFELATMFRDEVNENMPSNSTLGNKSSDIFGYLALSPNKILKTDYSFVIDNNIDKIKEHNVSTTFTVNNFITKFNFTEQNQPLGNTHYISNTTEYTFNESSSILFQTRRNKRIDLTEYYNFAYQYKNDCLTAAIKYNKEYYTNRDIKPTQELFFTLTIVPLGGYSTKNVFDNK
ncbi:organic solvent tolerance protein [Candidatus Pelagibacter sp.]|nr:organic solvent tolerance protein [Candidatus Pelagibacter sp.]